MKAVICVAAGGTLECYCQLLLIIVQADEHNPVSVQSLRHAARIEAAETLVATCSQPPPAHGQQMSRSAVSTLFSVIVNGRSMHFPFLMISYIIIIHT